MNTSNAISNINFIAITSAAIDVYLSKRLGSNAVIMFDPYKVNW